MLTRSEPRQTRPRLHPLSPRHLFLRTGRRRQYRCALLSLLLLAMLAGFSSHASAVVPYRSPEDTGPSPQARQHRDACRHQVLQALDGKIESEDFVARTDQEYYRYVVRKDLREILFICDAHTGEIRRQIDVWGNL